MARVKKQKNPQIAAKTKKEKSIVRSVVLDQKQNLYDQLKLSESYISLILGATVVFIACFLFFLFIKNNNSSKKVLPATTNITSNPTQAPKVKSYTLQDGEGLWDVAVKFYGDGFRWTDIAKANNIDEENSDYVDPGTKLTIPNVK